MQASDEEQHSKVEDVIWQHGSPSSLVPAPHFLLVGQVPLWAAATARKANHAIMATTLTFYRTYTTYSVWAEKNMQEMPVRRPAQTKP